MSHLNTIIKNLLIPKVISLKIILLEFNPNKVVGGAELLLPTHLNIISIKGTIFLFSWNGSKMIISRELLKDLIALGV